MKTTPTDIKRPLQMSDPG